VTGNAPALVRHRGPLLVLLIVAAVFAGSSLLMSVNLGMWVSAAAELVLFCGFVVAFVVVRRYRP
jgi:hypothetical protein